MVYVYSMCHIRHKDIYFIVISIFYKRFIANL